MKRIDFFKRLANCRQLLEVWKESRTPAIPSAVYKKLGEALRQTITNQDIVIGIKLSIVHKAALYELYLSARIYWFIDEETSPKKSYISDIAPMDWRLLKREDIAATNMTAYADFEKIKQYAID